MSQEEIDRGFQATVAHALRLHRKAQLLQAQVKESMEVAGSMAGYLGTNLSDPTILVDAITAVRAQEVPGRGALSGNVPSQWIVRYSKWKVGTKHVLCREDRAPWPGRNLPCAYVLADPEGQVLYIGKTMNLRFRMRSHADKPWATCTVMFCADEVEALRLEGDLIYQHQPPLNTADRKNRRFVRPA